jgi:hypothetical protein
MIGLFPEYLWLICRDGDAAAFAIMSRHYSFQEYQDGRRKNQYYRNRFLFVGPGEKLVLVTSDHKALFVWKKFKDDSGQEGVNCAVFRNEGAYDGRILSSELIKAAEKLAWQKWPGERLYTYVNTSKVNGDGLCFKKSGWKKCGRTKAKRLLILEKLPCVAAAKE